MVSSGGMWKCQNCGNAIDKEEGNKDRENRLADLDKTVETQRRLNRQAASYRAHFAHGPRP